MQIEDHHAHGQRSSSPECGKPRPQDLRFIIDSGEASAPLRSQSRLHQIEVEGMIFIGTNGDLMEICEIPEHPFFFGSQFHPVMKSRSGKQSPPFLAFVEAMKGRNKI